MDWRFGAPTGDEFRDQHDASALHVPPVDTWSTSVERDAYIKRRPALLAVAGILLALGALGWGLIRPESMSLAQWWGRALLGAVAAALVWCLVPYWASRRAFRQRKLATATARVDEAIQRIALPWGPEESQLPLSRLFELNRRQLDEYQEMTKKQQRSAFLLTQVASVAAFAALVVGISLTFQNIPDSEKYVVGGLSGLGALLSGFLAKTFFASHQAANEQLNRYYLEPQRTGRILAAERLARCLKDQPASQYTGQMITELLKWEMPSPNGDSPPSEESAPTAPQVGG